MDTLRREYLNEDTGEVAVFELATRKRRVFKRELDRLERLSPSQRRLKRQIEAENEVYWKPITP